MKGRVLVVSILVIAVCAVHAQASVFSSSGGGSSLQSVFNSIGYDYIDVADYQTDLNFKLQGMMEFQLLTQSGLPNLSFGVLESRETRFGTKFSHKTMFGYGSNSGVAASFNAEKMNATYGFFIAKKDPDRWWRQTRYYSYSPYNRAGAIQALFYADPHNSGSYLLAWEGIYVGDSHSDQSYDDMVVRMTVHPAPEPATWVLLASGLIGLVILGKARKKQSEMG
jgi:hypothetical protein